MARGWGEQPVYSRSMGLITRIEYNADKTEKYVGTAYPGTATSDAGWQIQSLTYNADKQVTSILLSNATDDFTAVWDDRATTSYS